MLYTALISCLYSVWLIMSVDLKHHLSLITSICIFCWKQEETCLHCVSDSRHSHILALLWLCVPDMYRLSPLPPGFPFPVVSARTPPTGCCCHLERNLCNVSNWVSAAVPLSQQLYWAFPSTISTVTNQTNPEFTLPLMSLSAALISTCLNTSGSLFFSSYGCCMSVCVTRWCLRLLSTVPEVDMWPSMTSPSPLSFATLTQVRGCRRPSVC